MPQNATTFLKDLRDNPLDCLRHYKIIIAGGGLKSKSGIATFAFEDKHRNAVGFTTGMSGFFGKTKNRPEVKLSHRSCPAKNELGGDEFDVHYVAMRQIGEDADASHYALSTTVGPDLMLTSQLSGCSFGIGSRANGARLVSHIQPKENRTAKELHDAVADGMDDNAKFFERENGGHYADKLNRATIVGIRRAKAWKFYVQHYKGNFGAVLDAKEL